MRYPLAFNSWDKKEKTAAIRVINSGSYTMGAKVKTFEKNFARKFKSKFAVMVNSGSSANLLMLSVLKNYPNILKKKNIRKPNIIVPSIGWSTSYYPINQNDFELNFVDVNRETLNIDPNEVKKAINKNTVAIMAINLLGNPCEFKILNQIAKKNNLILIEDNCESLGAKYNNQYCGTYGVMGTHSLFFSHHLQTMEGGVILTNNKIVYNYLLSLRAHGWGRDLPKKNSLYKMSGDKFKDLFTFITPGYCLRPLEIEAAIGIEQLKKLDYFLRIRDQNSKLFLKLFKDKNWCTVQKQYDNSISSWYGFNILLKGPLKNKRKFITKKLKKNGVEVRPTLTGHFLKNPVMKFLKYTKKGNFKNSKYIDQNGFFVGNYPKNLKHQIKYLYKLIEEEVH